MPLLSKHDELAHPTGIHVREPAHAGTSTCWRAQVAPRPREAQCRKMMKRSDPSVDTSEIEGHLLRVEGAVSSGRQGLLFLGAVPDHHVALEDHALREDDLPLDREAAALEEGG